VLSCSGKRAPTRAGGITLRVDSSAGWIVYVGGLVGAAFTGIYATRLMRLVFYGEMSDYAKEHLHSGHGEAPLTMLTLTDVGGMGRQLSQD